MRALNLEIPHPAVLSRTRSTRTCTFCATLSSRLAGNRFSTRISRELVDLRVDLHSELGSPRFEPVRERLIHPLLEATQFAFTLAVRPYEAVAEFISISVIFSLVCSVRFHAF